MESIPLINVCLGYFQFQEKWTPLWQPHEESGKADILPHIDTCLLTAFPWLTHSFGQSISLCSTRSREPSSCFHVPCASPGQERTHLGRARPTLPASHTHLLWWTKLWCSLHNPCQGFWLSPKTGDGDRDEGLDRLPFSSTVHRGTDFLISAYFLPLD